MTTTTNLGITKLDPGQSNAHVRVNEALDDLDEAVAGRLALSLSGSSTTLTGAQSTNHVLHITSTTGATDLVVQAVAKSWIVINDGSHTVTFKRASQGSPPTIAAGAIKHFVCDGTDVRVVA